MFRQGGGGGLPPGTPPPPRLKQVPPLYGAPPVKTLPFCCFQSWVCGKFSKIVIFVASGNANPEVCPAAHNLGNDLGTGEYIPFVNRTLNGIFVTIWVLWQLWGPM